MQSCIVTISCCALNCAAHCIEVSHITTLHDICKQCALFVPNTRWCRFCTCSLSGRTLFARKVTTLVETGTYCGGTLEDEEHSAGVRSCV